MKERCDGKVFHYLSFIDLSPIDYRDVYGMRLPEVPAFDGRAFATKWIERTKLES
jgi:hypothetical protein